MKLLLVLSLVFAYSYAGVIDHDWEAFKTKFSKTYASLADEQIHYNQFKAKQQAIVEHNQRYSDGLESYYKGINQYSDLSVEELKSVALGFKMSHRQYTELSHRHLPNFENPLPKEVDWRTKKVVTPVKDQGMCGSCWAFSVIGAMEGQHALATKKLVSLSEQNLVDCTNGMGNYGCQGGWPYIAWEYIIREARGIDTEDAYPYTGTDQECAFDQGGIGATATAFAILTPGNETVLQEAVANIGPISVCIAAGGGFMDYKGGVLDDTSCSSDFNDINHCVTAVGYGKDKDTGKDYWLIKNSWGTIFGEQGYIRMSRNNKNQCAISTLASYPTV